MRFLVVAGLLLTATTVGAQDRSGVRPQVLSLPTGPGSIEGLGESFEPSESTGTSSFQVGLAFPPAVAGFGPSLALGYSSGGGNTELGLGWSLGLPTVQRGTDRGLPRYDDDDVFILRGLGGATEDLVRLADGSYRYRIEGGFVRGRQRDDGSWEFRSRDGTRHRFGSLPDATIADAERVFAWCLTEQEDTHGNLIRYEHERDETGRPYLARIIYNDFSSAVRNEVRFEYEGRPDALTSFVSTFPVTLARRLNAVAILHGGETIRRYELTYRMTGGISRLESVEVVGRDGESRLPDIRFEYAELVTDAMRVVEMADAPARALGEVTEITDVDGDALPDLLVADPGLDGGRYSFYPNLDGRRFGARASLDASPSVWLASPEVQLADMDGDGAADVVARISANADGFRYYPSAGIGAAGFGARVDVTPNVPTPLSDPDTQLVDLDHDRLVDWMRTDPTTGRITVGFNLGGGAFAAPTELPVLDASSLVTFSRGAKLADVNGDSLQDVVEIRDGAARVFFSMGFGRFTEAVSLTGAPDLSDTERAELQIRDVSGDGLADLVHVGTSQVRVWLGVSGRGFDAPITIRGTPPRRPTTVIRVADVNGNGSADIVWVDPADTSAPWRYLDLLADGSPGLLTRIENGLGRIHRISYAGLGAMWGWARENGIEPSHRCSAGQTVVASITIEDGVSPPMVTELRYADAYFDGPSREFRGFAVFEGRDLGDTTQPTLVTEQRFDVGETEEARKGLPLSSRRLDETGRVFDESRHDHTLLDVATDAEGRAIVFAYESRTETTMVEGSSEPVVLVSERELDRFGNETRVVEWGVFAASDPNAGRDERVTVRSFANNESAWILGAVSSERVEDLEGRRYQESRTYYDGEPFEGLPLGEVERGDVSRTERWIESDRWQTETRQRFDTFGNVVEDVDARGARHWVDWDEASHTFPEVEREQVAHGLELQWRAEHDRAFGVVTRVFEPNDEVRRFEHDAFGRLVATYEPGDPDNDPTRSFEYLYSNPISTIRERTQARDQELVTIHHVDGLGRSAGVFLSAGDGLWHTSEVTTYGPRGLKTRVLYPSERRNADVPREAGLPATRFVHDATGRMLEEIEVDGSIRRTEYRPLITITSDPNDTDETSVHFDSPSTIRMDGLERIVSVIRREGERGFETTYTYDPLGNLAGFVDARGSARSYVYDGLSRPLRVEDPNAGTWRWVYDESDVRERIDPLGNVMRYEVDLAGRRIREYAREAGTEEERLTVAWYYDVPSDEHSEARGTYGRLAWVRDEAGSIYYDYDERGRLATQTRRWEDGTEHTTWSDHDRAGHVVRRGFPDGTHIEQSFDARGFVRSVGPIVRDVRWTAFQRLDRVEYGNGIVDDHTHDVRMRLTEMNGGVPGRDPLRHIGFDYDRASRLTGRTDRRGGVSPERDLSATYTFDDRYRLVGEITARSSTTWSHDDVGNMTSVASSGTDPVGNFTAAYGLPDGGPDWIASIDSERVTYDAAGRFLQDGARAYTWDAKGLLVRVETVDVVEEYVYDADDQRVIKRTTRDGETTEVRYVDRDVEIRDGKVVRYVFLEDQRVARLDALPNANEVEGAVIGPWPFVLAVLGSLVVLLVLLARLQRPAVMQRAVTWLAPLFAAAVAVSALAACGNGRRDPRDRSAPIAEVPDDAVFYLDDLQGAPLVTVDRNGEEVSDVRYDPHGARDSRGPAEPWGFVGNEVDATGLGYFNARYYRYDIGAFISPDPVAVFETVKHVGEPELLYTYAYGAGDPVNNPDGSGRILDTILDVGFIVYDVYRLVADGPEHREENLAALAADGVGLAVPFATGAGLAARAAYKASKAIDRATDATRAASGATDAARAARTGKASQATKAPATRGCSGSSCRRPAGRPCLCLAAGTVVHTYGPDGLVTLTPIEQIDVGTRVVTHGDRDCDSAIDDPRALELSIPGFYGVEVVLLRSAQWIDEQQITPGSSTAVYLEQLGVVALARVERIRPVDVVDGPGCTVDAITRTSADQRREVLFNGERVVMTPSHPVYSLDRLTWTPVRLVIPGERLRGTNGTLVVESNEELNGAGSSHVFNLSVSRDHTFVVGDSALLVHNTNPGDCGGRMSGVPDSVTPAHPKAGKYQRPRAAGPTKAQTASVQGRPCVEPSCGMITSMQVADHIEPLVVEHWKTGMIDVARQSMIEAVQPHCPGCSMVQGGQLSGMSSPDPVVTT